MHWSPLEIPIDPLDALRGDRSAPTHKLAAAGYLPPVAGAIWQEVIDLPAVANALRTSWRPRSLTDCPVISIASVRPSGILRPLGRGSDKVAGNVQTQWAQEWQETVGTGGGEAAAGQGVFRIGFWQR